MIFKGLYPLLAALLLLSAALLVRQRGEEMHFSREQESIRLHMSEERRLAEIRRSAEREQSRLRAENAVAVAGEYWKIARKACRDVAAGQVTLRRAKELLSAGDYAKSDELARRAIEELKTARKSDIAYGAKRAGRERPGQRSGAPARKSTRY